MARRKPKARTSALTTLAPAKRAAPLALVGKRRGRSIVESQPSVRAYQHWTPRHLQTMHATCDSGELARLGDLCDQIMADDRVDKLLEDLSGGVLGCDLSFEKNARTSIGDAEKAAEMEADWPLGWTEDELAALLGWTTIVGVGFARHDGWRDTEDGRVVPTFKSWHPKNFRYSWEAREWLVRDEIGNERVIRAGDGEWIIMTRKGDFRPWANGQWRGLAAWWLLKRYAISDWGVHSEKSAKLVLTADEGAMTEERKQLADEIFELAKDAVISLPAGFNIQLVELSADTREIYQAQIDAADMGFAIAILGQNLTSRVDGGSYAAANTHERKELRVFRYAAKKLGRTLQEQSFPWWAEFNFGDRKLAPYPKWQTDPPEDKGAKVETLATLGTALNSLQTAGFKLSTDTIEEEYGIKLEAMSASERAALHPPTPGSAGSVTPTRNAPREPGAKPVPIRPVKPVRTPAGARLADDDELERTSGFRSGQLYVDDLAEQSADQAGGALRGMVDRVLEAVDGAQSYGEVRAAILRAFEDEPDPERLSELIEAGMVMAQLAGRYAVLEDADDDELDDDEPKLFNPNHDKRGRFSSAPGGGKGAKAKGAPRPTGGRGGDADPAVAERMRKAKAQIADRVAKRNQGLRGGGGGGGPSSSKDKSEPAPAVPSAPNKRRALLNDPALKFTAERQLGEGATAPRLVTAAGADGRSMKVIWKSADNERGESMQNIEKALGGPLRPDRAAGTFYQREGASSDLDELLGGDRIVPVTVVREVNGKRGSLQEYVPGARPTSSIFDDHFDKPEAEVRLASSRAARKQLVMDAIAGQDDRHSENTLWRRGKGGQLEPFAIDNGLAFSDQPQGFYFGFEGDHYAREVVKLDSATKADLRAMKLDELAARLRGYDGITDSQIRATLQRARSLQNDPDQFSRWTGDYDHMAKSMHGWMRQSGEERVKARQLSQRDHDEIEALVVRRKKR